MPNLSSLVNPASSVITNTDANPVPTTVSDASVALEEIAFYLGKLVKMSESSAVVDVNQRQRVVSEVTTLAQNQSVIVRGEGNSSIYNANTNSFGTFYTVPDVWRTIEMARQNYQISIRSNLQFS
jgi:hypothetical protein